MPRPSISAKLTPQNQSKGDMEKRLENEERLKGNSDKIKAPGYLNDKQTEIFNYIVDELHASEILGNLDIYILETCSIAIERIQEIEILINNNANILVNKGLMSAKDKYTKDFFRCCNELCLSPQSRAKLGNINLKAQEDENDPLLKILQGGKNAN